jgi:hypothetical protein
LVTHTISQTNPRRLNSEKSDWRKMDSTIGPIVLSSFHAMMPMEIYLAAFVLSTLTIEPAYVGNKTVL